MVKSMKHQGHQLDSDMDMVAECKLRKNIYIQKSTEVIELFKFAHPSEVFEAIDIYCMDWYGSNLWKFETDAVRQVFNTWNRMVKDVFNVPYATHTSIVMNLLSERQPVQVDVFLRFQTFVKSLLKSPSDET